MMASKKQKATSTKKTRSAFAQRERGQMLGYFAGALFALLAAAALISDANYLFRERSRMQATADSAALAAAMELDQLKLSQSHHNLRILCMSSGRLHNCQTAEDAAAPYINQYPGAKVDISVKELPRTVQVTIERTVPTFFSGVFGLNGITIKVEAVAALTDQY